MAIVEGPTTLTGEVGVKPVLKRMVTTDSLSTITTAGYLNRNLTDNLNLQNSDLLMVIYDYVRETDSGNHDFFNVSISGGVVTLSASSGTGNVVLPTVAGDLAEFNNTTGKIENSGLATNTVLYGDVINPTLNANIFYVNTVCAALDLNGGGQVNAIVPASGTERFRILDVFVNQAGTNFSGGGGDRDLYLTDGTTSFTVIGAALMQSLANARWGATNVSYPNTSINTESVNGETLRFAYSGGTTDYSTGNMVISMLVERVA